MDALLRKLVVVGLLAAPSGAWAGMRIVLFEDGRSLEVRQAERLGDLARLALAGGGEIALPADRIVNWEELSRRPAAKPAAGGAGEARGAHWRLSAGEYADLIEDAAVTYDLDPALLAALARAESDFDPLAVSSKGACGLLQLMPATAERFGVEDVFDPTQNVDGGARYLRWLLERYSGRTDLALAGYNAGEGAVDRYRGIPPYPETDRYVRQVLEDASLLAGLAP